MESTSKQTPISWRRAWKSPETPMEWDNKSTRRSNLSIATKFAIATGALSALFLFTKLNGDTNEMPEHSQPVQPPPSLSIDN